MFAAKKVTSIPSQPRTPASARLRELRIAAGLTQQELANRRGVDVRQVRRFETGESPMEALEMYLELEELSTRRAA